MLNGKSILVVVPARGGSKGVKLKNIRKINGVPLVALVGHVVRQLPYVDRAVVSTDHPEIAEIAEKYRMRLILIKNNQYILWKKDPGPAPPGPLRSPEGD